MDSQSPKWVSKMSDLSKLVTIQHTDELELMLIAERKLSKQIIMLSNGKSSLSSALFLSDLGGKIVVIFLKGRNFAQGSDRILCNSHIFAHHKISQNFAS